MKPYVFRIGKGELVEGAEAYLKKWGLGVKVTGNGNYVVTGVLDFARGLIVLYSKKLASQNSERPTMPTQAVLTESNKKDNFRDVNAAMSCVAGNRSMKNGG
ncbi:MAG: hypothetical protein HY365_01725 [Candidatus Aenigmarchaeota archaeon]|nr:hypothetical protein [Candidatus Aenigmarchaeota archaeon]